MTRIDMEHGRYCYLWDLVVLAGFGRQTGVYYLVFSAAYSTEVAVFGAQNAEELSTESYVWDTCKSAGIEVNMHEVQA